ncbi:hypothetical protein FPQ18DRAFT_13987 [Pyronema domesticum]|nr:hypothetical protein FPQ18DRAFT_13987 [Pyronema domesticum]
MRSSSSFRLVTAPPVTSLHPSSSTPRISHPFDPPPCSNPSPSLLPAHLIHHHHHHSSTPSEVCSPPPKTLARSYRRHNNLICCPFVVSSLLRPRLSNTLLPTDTTHFLPATLLFSGTHKQIFLHLARILHTATGAPSLFPLVSTPSPSRFLFSLLPSIQLSTPPGLLAGT